MRLNMNKLNNRLGILLSSCIYVVAFLIVHPSIIAQEAGSLDFKEYKGVIVNAKTQKSLEYASISVTNSNIATISNLEGVFLVKVPNSLKGENVVIRLANICVGIGNHHSEPAQLRCHEKEDLRTPPRSLVH